MLGIQAKAEPTFLEWADLLFPPTFLGTRRMVLLASYHDRSTTNDDGVPIFAVAGYLSSNIQWYHDFCGPWTKTLEKYGLESFHMTDFENRWGPYEGWGNAKREAAIGEFLDIIGRTALLGVGAALVLKDYDALDPSERAFLGTPYHLCSMWCAREIRRWLEREHILEGVAYVFESGDVGAGEVQRGLQESAGVSARTRVLSVTFADKVQYPQLQAADIIAYETAKSTLRMAGMSSRPNTRKSLDRLLHAVPHEGGFFDAATLPGLIQELRRALGV